MNRIATSMFWLLAGLGLSAALLFGQATQGLIAGRIVDSQSGVAVAAANIAFDCATVSNRGSVVSDRSGRYVIPLLPPGSYRLRITAEGFQPQELYDLQVPVAGRLDIDFRLRRLNDVWETGQFRSVFLHGTKTLVTFYGPDVDSSRSAFVAAGSGNTSALESTISQVIDPGLIRDLPLAGRDVYTVLVTQPGATADTTTGRGLGLSVNGQRPSASNFLLDGVENNNFLVTGPAAAVAPEAVQEYRVSTANFTAEYGRSAGFVANAVTRAGGSQWHGLGYVYLKNEALNANGFQQNVRGVDRPPLKEIQGGYQAGGRILTDRLFLSSALEGFRSRGRGEPLEYRLPTRGLLNFTAPGTIARELLEQNSGTLLPDTRLHSGTVSLRPPASVDRLLALERVDSLWRGGRHRLFGRIAIGRLGRPDFQWSPYPAFVTPLNQNNWNVAVALQSPLRPALINEFRIAIGRDDLRWDRTHPEIPTLASGDGTILPGSPGAYGYRNRGRNLEFLENLTWVRGRHIVKVGGSALLRNLDGELTAGRDGYYFFGSLLDFGLDRPSLLWSAVARASLPKLVLPDFAREYRYRQFSVFAQDTFQLSRRLVVDYGVRYENFGAPLNTGVTKDLTVTLGTGADFRARIAASRLTLAGSGDRQLYAADHRGWAGRFGFSFAPAAGGHTLLRGAYGIFYDRPFDNLWQNLRGNNLALSTFTVTSSPANYLAPISTVLAGFQGQVADPGFPYLTLLRGDLKNPYVHSFFLGVQQRVAENWSIEANTQGSLGRRLITTDAVNRGADNPNLPYIYYRANQGLSNFNALTVAARYRGSRGQFHLAYTWSHTIDNQSEPLAGDFLDLSFSRVTSASSRPNIAAFQREFDSRGDRGNSDFDQRHNLVFYSIWDLPGVLRQWKFAQVAAFRSGFPYTVLAPAGFGPDGQVYLNRRADTVRANTAPARENEVPGGRQLLDPAAFLEPPDGRPGTTGRNAFRGPGLFNLDLSLSRSFAFRRLGEAGRLTVRADAFNFLNHANLNTPDPFIDSPTFGAARYGRTGRDAGFPALTPFNETARQIQLIFRVEF